MKEARRVRGKFGLPRTRTSHFGHGNIIKYCYRPFLSDNDQKVFVDSGMTWENSKHRISYDSIRIMDQTIIDAINHYVQPEDELWHLGDFAFAKQNYVDKIGEYVNQINCKNIHLVYGNHDKRYAKNKNGNSISQFFRETYDLTSIDVSKQKIVLCHYALAIWDKSHRGAWHLYGHSHAGAEQNLNKVFPNRRSMDVGVDHAYRLFGEYRPFEFAEVKRILDHNSGHSLDHHH